MRSSWKTFFVAATVVLTAVNPASACRGRFRRCCPPPSCYVQCTPYVEVDCCGGPSSELPAPAEMPAPSQPAPRTPTPAAPPLPSAPMPEDSLRPTPPPAAVEPPATFEQPAAAEPSAPADDMPLPSEVPATPPAEEPALETPAKPAEDVEDLFKDTDAKPAEAPADTTPAKPADKADDVEDLFKDTDEKKAATSEPAQEEPMDTAPSSEVEDLFSEPTDKPSTSAGLDSKPAAEELSPMRLWTDNTGKYQVRARLLVVGDRYVRLLKETGKTTTVPFSRLSGSDLAFVQHQVSGELAGNF
jgi:hypothetical protein